MPQDQEAYQGFFPFYAALLDKQKTVRCFKIKLILIPTQHISTHLHHIALKYYMFYCLTYSTSPQ